MTSHSSPRPVTALRARMIEDMTVRGPMEALFGIRGASRVRRRAASGSPAFGGWHTEPSGWCAVAIERLQTSDGGSRRSISRRPIRPGS